jgi:hypothetical protein
MPYKFNEARRHEIPKAKYKVTNWSDYDTATVRRGSLTVRVREEAIAAWHAPATGKRGGQPVYSCLGSFRPKPAKCTNAVYMLKQQCAGLQKLIDLRERQTQHCPNPGIIELLESRRSSGQRLVASHPFGRKQCQILMSPYLVAAGL